MSAVAKSCSRRSAKRAGEPPAASRIKTRAAWSRLQPAGRQPGRAASAAAMSAADKARSALPMRRCTKLMARNNARSVSAPPTANACASSQSAASPDNCRRSQLRSNSAGVVISCPRDVALESKGQDKGRDRRSSEQYLPLPRHEESVEKADAGDQQHHGVRNIGSARTKHQDKSGKHGPKQKKIEDERSTAIGGERQGVS